jgi:hypothetical protein
MWWMRGAHVPALLTTSPPGTLRTAAGIIGTPGTQVLFGDTHVNDDLRSGLRTRLGAWLDCECKLGIEARFFILEGRGDGLSVSCPPGSDQIFARPFINAATGAQDAELVCFPGVVSGTAAVDAGSANFLGFDLLGREALCCTPCFRLDFVGGYRFLRYDDNVRIVESLAPEAAPFVPGTQIAVDDSFGAQNHFHGGGIGLACAFQRGPWSLDVMAKIDVGKVFREVTILGNTTVTVPGAAPAGSTGGLLTQVTNIGTFRSDDWALAPQLDLEIGYRPTDHVRLFLGYSLLVWTEVARAGEQIDPVVNRTLIPPATQPITGPLRPAVSPNQSDLWVQGLSVGLEWRY